ncbi:beta-ketoacyl synthase N-terminal-like domain-containing protein [Photorhabdus sp. SF281]|uniref:beta-ketoacyl synthase N-terminal-like domain-containing protein n=1 Tax=Photorhabdus sp. SF281 TaxID=3459527 RepID=UPI004044B39C
MAKLPVITAFGGYGPAGLSSSHHAFRRMVIDSLHEEQQQETILSLAVLMRLLKYDQDGYYHLHGERLSAVQAAAEIKEAALEGSLIRKITKDYFDVDAITRHAKLSMAADAGVFSFDIFTRQIPNPLPQGWSVALLTDDQGFGGMLQSRLKGGRVSAKQCPLGLNSMCADFLNAYVLGSVGHTSATLGACGTFLYNLNAVVEDVKAGRIRVAIVGSSEAPILPKVIEGFDAMSALATESKLKRMDESDIADWCSSRPFGNSCGFVITESSVQKASFIQAYGSSTPKNCVSEADIFDRVAEVFSISEWPVTAVKSYLGHSLGPASGDQLVSCLGTFKYGILPGIKSVSQISSQVNNVRLLIPTQDRALLQEQAQVAFINSKGFGGNNATEVVYSPLLMAQWLHRRHGEQAFVDYQQRNQQVKARMIAYDTAASRGKLNVIYKFGLHDVNEDEVKIDMNGITMPGFEQPIRYSKTKKFIDF